MLILVAALLVAAALLKAAAMVTGGLRPPRAEATRTRVASLISVFAPACAEAERDARAILAWEPLSRTAHRLFPEEFALLDEAHGGAFPFGKERLLAAHSRWTAEWLAWERAHDFEFKLKAAVAEHELAASGGSAVARAKLDAVEREKLDLYQQRYQEYIRISKGLQALL